MIVWGSASVLPFAVFIAERCYYHLLTTKGCVNRGRCEWEFSEFKEFREFREFREFKEFKEFREFGI